MSHYNLHWHVFYDGNTRLPLDLSHWPIPGDRLMDGSGASVTTTEQLYEAVTLGYKAAGDILIDAFIRSDHKHDEILLPALFCYGQFLELKIKSVTSAINRHYGTGPTDYMYTHDLKDLWNIMEKAAKLAKGPSFSSDDIFNQAKKCTMELHYIDRKGDGFRYPDVIAQLRIAPCHIFKVITDVAVYLDAFHDFCTNGEP